MSGNSDLSVAGPDLDDVLDESCVWRSSPGASRYLRSKGDDFRTRFLDGVRRRLQAEGSPVVVVERDGEPPLVAQAISGKRANDRAAFASVISLSHLHDTQIPSEALLSRIYNLTPAETRIAQGISRGDSLEEIAANLAIRISTARTQLASIFEKTNTRRQAKLVAILSHLAHLER